MIEISLSLAISLTSRSDPPLHYQHKSSVSLSLLRLLLNFTFKKTVLKCLHSNTQSFCFIATNKERIYFANSMETDIETKLDTTT